MRLGAPAAAVPVGAAPAGDAGGLGLSREASFDCSECGDEAVRGVGKCGLGMTFRQSSATGMLEVRRVKEGGAALAAGIREGDVIVALDRQPLQRLTRPAIARLMLGPAGSVVELQLQRAGSGRAETLVLERRAAGGGGVSRESSWQSLAAEGGPASGSAPAGAAAQVCANPQPARRGAARPRG